MVVPRGTLQRVAGAAFVVSVVLFAAAVAVLLLETSDASGPVSAIAGGSLVAFIVGMLGLRCVVTEQTLRPLGLTSLAAVVATIIGTTTHISGVALGLPVTAIAIFVLARSKWQLGDAAILVIVTGCGTGAAYVLAATLDPDTGSYGDQGAIALIALGIALSSLAVALLSEVSRPGRTLLMVGFLFAAISFGELIGGVQGAPLLSLTLGAALLNGGAWLWLGLMLWRAEHAFDLA